MGQVFVAYAHFVAIFATLALLAAEIAIYGRTMLPSQLETLRKLDIAYLGGAFAIVATGLVRVFTSPKGVAYYQHNPVFWTKMTLFVLVAVLSVPPTMHYLGRYRASYGTIRAYHAAQLVIFFLIPLAAAAMARGVGA